MIGRCGVRGLFCFQRSVVSGLAGNGQRRGRAGAAWGRGTAGRVALAKTGDGAHVVCAVLVAVGLAPLALGVGLGWWLGSWWAILCASVVPVAATIADDHHAL
ncbi:MAG: hypothetical protein R2873_27985 [Caldilineaceae bacterium]